MKKGDRQMKYTPEEMVDYIFDNDLRDEVVAATIHNRRDFRIMFSVITNCFLDGEKAYFEVQDLVTENTINVETNEATYNHISQRKKEGHECSCHLS